MSSDRVVFVVATEYHLMVAISLILEDFDPDKCLIATFSDRNDRLNSVSDFSYLGIKSLGFDFSEIKQDATFGDKLSYLEGFKPGKIAIFLENDPISIFLGRRFAKTDTRIVLAPDGLKAYNLFKSSGLRSKVKLFRKYYRVLWDLGAKVIKPYISKLDYGHLKEVEEIWVEKPEKCPNVFRKGLIRITLFKEKDTIAHLKRIFNFPADLLEVSDGITLYVNNILFNQDAEAMEYELLKELSSQKSSQVLLKIHPSTSVAHRSRLQSLPISILTQNFPAELLILGLTNSRIVSGWSTSLLCKQPESTNRYYWIWRVFRKNGCMFENLAVTNPTDHIQEVEDFSEIL